MTARGTQSVPRPKLVTAIIVVLSAGVIVTGLAVTVSSAVAQSFDGDAEWEDESVIPYGNNSNVTGMWQNILVVDGQAPSNCAWVDGSYGPNTLDATKGYQTKHKWHNSGSFTGPLVVDGIVGGHTFDEARRGKDPNQASRHLLWTHNSFYTYYSGQAQTAQFWRGGGTWVWQEKFGSLFYWYSTSYSQNTLATLCN